MPAQQQNSKFFNLIITSILTLQLAGVGYIISVVQDLNGKMGVWIERTVKVEAKQMYHEFETIDIKNRITEMEAILKKEEEYDLKTGSKNN